ncbi:PREDICTED: uncharacterized protein LOC106788546 [Polistes canadensis]|uniref:uncharacterized protein LOC106788546 n=1 Tax=Polistes canadensis TaxID=91411 RepID=UPI000718F818|nr:PREDICTED: uncharacterized protein LOC106788546 [Polistes canadensis]XP_014607380.1 PREDICTED: uncharacterized protein LOC106788546 [Polistes canadensis]
MNMFIRSIILLTLLLIINNGKNKLVYANSGLIINFLQSNIAGLPNTHQETEWNFDPDVGKQRRIDYEAVNGFRGEKAIAKLGTGIGYSGSWGTPSKKQLNRQ